MTDAALIDVYPYWKRKKAYKQYMFRGVCPVYCAYCASRLTLEEATVEHVVPRKYGGRDSYDNFLIACADCNEAEGKDRHKIYRRFRGMNWKCFQCGEGHYNKRCSMTETNIYKADKE